MTHDELLHEITHHADQKTLDALRAVVELHKPIGWTVAPVVRCSCCGVAYPCQTVQAIEFNLQ
jgi:hypothetical protein